MKLKDKRIEIQESRYTTDKYGNHKRNLSRLRPCGRIFGSFPQMRYTG